MKGEALKMILSGIGSGFQYVFLGFISVFILYMTYDLVLQDKIGGEVYIAIASAISGGALALMNPRGRREQEEKEPWTGQERRTRRETDTQAGG